MNTIVLIFSVLALAWAAPQKDTSDLDAVNTEVFGKSNKISAARIIPLNPDNTSKAVTSLPPAGGETTKCITNDGKSGECRPYYLCDFSLIDNVGLLETQPRIGLDPIGCPSYIDLCCLDTETPADPIISTPQILT